VARGVDVTPGSPALHTRYIRCRWREIASFARDGFASVELSTDGAATIDCAFAARRKMTKA